MGVQHIALFLMLFLCSAVAANAAQLGLSWTDNSDNEEGFRVERRPGNSGDFAVIAEPRANNVFYIDTALLPASEYCYRVLAFNAAGSSGYSNESCATTRAIEAALEGPGDGQTVAGVGVLRGWTFDATAGHHITALSLFIDDVPTLTIPCCAARGDVQAAYPQFPELNTLNSGWGSSINWGELAAGSHMVHLRAESTSGQTLEINKQTITIVRFADFPFVDLFSLAEATVWLEGNDVVIENVLVRDKASQRQARIKLYLRWLTNAQAFQVVATETLEQLASSRSFFSSVFAVLASLAPEGPPDAQAQASENIVGTIESPGTGQVSAGIGTLRGWAFSGDAEATIRTLQVFIDDQSMGSLPCCSVRGDVAALFPDYPAAGNSGWGAAVNYGGLPAGPHTITIQVTDSREISQTFTRAIETIRIGDATFVDELHLAGATAQLEGEDLVLSGVSVRDQVTQETRLVTLRLRWFENAQAFSIIASTVGLL